MPGEWQGYVNNDELCPYWFGIFGPGQVGVVRDYSYAYHGNGSDKFITWADNDEAYTKTRATTFLLDLYHTEVQAVVMLFLEFSLQLL